MKREKKREKKERSKEMNRTPKSHSSKEAEASCANGL
jgi:hypothetical protein